MAEEEKTELPEITEEKIEKAALPENKRVDEEISEEATFVELDEADVKELGPVTHVANCRHCNTPKNSKPKTSS